MKLKLFMIGLILLLIAISGCIETNSQSSSDNSNLDSNLSTFQSINSNNRELFNKTSLNYEANGFCYHVVDGDTIDVDNVGRIRFVGIDTPETDEPGYQEAKDFVKKTCLGKTVYLDIDNAKHYDKYGRVLAVVYVNDININAALLKGKYADIMYIPPSEFNPYSWT